jgi:hypothetical protein
MTLYTDRRPLSDLLLEMSDSVSSFMPVEAAEQREAIGLHPTSLSCTLPVETSFVLSEGQLQLLIGVPQRHERTYFDRPVNRLAFHFVAEAT